MPQTRSSKNQSLSEQQQPPGDNVVAGKGVLLSVEYVTSANRMAQESPVTPPTRPTRPIGSRRSTSNTVSTASGGTIFSPSSSRSSTPSTPPNDSTVEESTEAEISKVSDKPKESNKDVFTEGERAESGTASESSTRLPSFRLPPKDEADDVPNAEDDEGVAKADTSDTSESRSNKIIGLARSTSSPTMKRGRKPRARIDGPALATRGRDESEDGARRSRCPSKSPIPAPLPSIQALEASSSHSRSRSSSPNPRQKPTTRSPSPDNLKQKEGKSASRRSSNVNDVDGDGDLEAGDSLNAPSHELSPSSGQLFPESPSPTSNERDQVIPRVSTASSSASLSPAPENPRISTQAGGTVGVIKSETYPVWEKYHIGEDSSDPTISELIFSYIEEKKKKPIEIERGHVYILSSDMTRGHYKIGKTIYTPEKRMKQMKRCILGLLQVPDDHDVPFSHPYIVEQIVHKQLENKRKKFKCKTCGQEHREWFALENAEEGLKLIRRWRRWAQSEPFKPDFSLVDHWKWKLNRAEKAMEKVDWDRWVQFTSVDFILYQYQLWDNRLDSAVQDIVIFCSKYAVPLVFVLFCAIPNFLIGSLGFFLGIVIGGTFCHFWSRHI